MRLEKQLIVVTGGASGMGAGVVRLLAQAGGVIAIIDQDEVNAIKVAQEVGGNVYLADVTSAQQIESMIAQITKELGPIRVCVNCAGVAPAQRIVGREGSSMPLESFQRVIDINLIGTFNVMRLVAENMISSQPVNEDGERGVIINTASIAAFEGQIGQTAYSAAKGGIVALTLPAARELSQFGIRVNTIAPGLIDTPMMQAMPEKVQDSLQAQTVFPHRLGKTEEFAKLVLHMVENPLINGETIRLDGAVRLSSH